MTAYALNLLDLVFTLYALHNGAVELNPAMRCVPVMIVYKVVIVGALCWWLGHHNTKLARSGWRFITAVYAAVNIWHIVNLLQ